MTDWMPSPAWNSGNIASLNSASSGGTEPSVIIRLGERDDQHQAGPPYLAVFTERIGAVRHDERPP